MKVKDWMTRGYLGIPSNTSITGAITTMLRLHLSGLPVVDEGQRILGIVTLSDIRRRLLLPQGEMHRHEEALHRPELLEERLKEIADDPVEGVMTKEVLTIGPDEPLLTAAALMNARRVRQIPVVEGKQVVGLITPHDVAWAFLTSVRRRR